MKHLLLILFLPMIFNISLMGQDKSEQDRQKIFLDCLVKIRGRYYGYHEYL